MKKKHILLVLPYCGVIFLQTRPKLQQAFEDVLNCYKLLFRFFPFKDPLSKDLIYGVVYKFQCGLCSKSYYGENISHLNIRFGEHIGVPPLTGTKVKSINNKAVGDHLLHCNYLYSFNNFSILEHEKKSFYQKLKKAF